MEKNGSLKDKFIFRGKIGIGNWNLKMGINYDGKGLKKGFFSN